MTKAVSSLYTVRHSALSDQIRSHLDRGCRLASDRPLLFFRADDIGIVSGRFARLIGCFRRHRMPLCLATVPAWLSQKRLEELLLLTGKNSSQWYWHQHGRLHRNFEPAGKKQEFGPARSKEEVKASIKKGRLRLEALLDADFQPVFTPPWNRCSDDTLRSLVELDFKAVSRSSGARPAPPPGLADFQVNVDLHTRKEKQPQTGLNKMLTELEQGLASGLCGIMIHHQRMNETAFFLLDILLESIRHTTLIAPVHFGDLLHDHTL